MYITICCDADCFMVSPANLSFEQIIVFSEKRFNKKGLLVYRNVMLNKDNFQDFFHKYNKKKGFVTFCQLDKEKEFKKTFKKNQQKLYVISENKTGKINFNDYIEKQNIAIISNFNDLTFEMRLGITLTDNCTKGNKISKLKLKNITIDFEQRGFKFPDLKKLKLVNSKAVINAPNIQKFSLKCDFESFKGIIEPFEKCECSLLKQLKVNLVALNQNKVDISSVLSSKIFQKTDVIKLKLQGNLSYETDIISSIVLSKVTSLKVALFQNNDKSLINFLRKLENLSLLEIQNNSFTKEELQDIFKNPSLKHISITGEESYKIIEGFERKASYLENCEEIEINFDKYSIDNLKEVSLALFDYSEKDNSITLYGEANLNFYNDVNLNFIKDLIEKKGFSFNKVQFRNFDIENIDYLAKLVKSFGCIKKVSFDNLGINTNFVNAVKEKSVFYANSININNVVFLEDEAETEFYKMIEGHSFQDIQIRNIDSLENFYAILNRFENIRIEEVYEIDYERLTNVLNENKNKLVSLKFIKNDFNPSVKEALAKIIDNHKESLRKIKIVGEEKFSFTFLPKEEGIFNENVLKSLKQLDLLIDNADSKEKTTFLLKLSKQFPKLKKINFELFSLSQQKKNEIVSLYPMLTKIE